MRIHCDVCGIELRKEDALILESDEEVLYFCSEECLERKGYHETMADPGREEEAAPPDVR